jgi:hypothetical protein
MKKIRAMCAALTLLIMLSFSTMGGHIHTDAVPTPTPTPTPEFAASEPDSEAETDTLLAEITVSILQLLSVF